MKTIYLTLAAVSAATIAPPLSAQAWHGDRAGAQSNTEHGNRTRDQDVGRMQHGIVGNMDLRRQIDQGIARGTITRREAITLRIDLDSLIRLARNYGRDGFSRTERETLVLRGDSLARMIQRADGTSDRRAEWSDDRGSDYAEPIAVSVGAGYRGDRYSGDLRVGQHYSARQVALPVRYRARYRDDERSFYRYEANRVYQIDRSSGLILAMFDVSN